MSLINAILWGNYELADQLITNGYGLNETDRSGFTPLMLLLCHLEMENRKEKYTVCLELITKLIDAGVDVNIKNIGGNTALNYAIWFKNYTVVRMLIDVGADVNIKNDDGKTALIYSMCFYRSIYTGRMPIDAGTDVNIKDNNGYTALSYAVKRHNRYSSIDAVKILIEADF